MAFKLKVPSAQCRTRKVLLPASTAFAAGCVIAPDEAGTGAASIAATASSTKILGVLKKAVTSTDSDYASTKWREVIVDEGGEWEADVTTGTIDANDVGNLADLTDEDGINVTASSVDVFRIDRVKSGKARGNFLIWY